MKFLFDYFPIICFFIAYKFSNIYTATEVTIAASLVQLSVYWLIHRRFETLHTITFVFVVLLGGSTLLFHKDIFIKWKPSVIYWIFALTLVFSQFFSTKTVLERMLSDKISLGQRIWKRLNMSWAVFFLMLGFLNLYVVYHFDTNAWVNFKLFGTLGITLIFIVAQAVYMTRHMQK
ncbi:MAG TPA: septation protein A [Nitrosomonas sp.]|nr:septation protein A [Nitrosomonas sp.]